MHSHSTKRLSNNKALRRLKPKDQNPQWHNKLQSYDMLQIPLSRRNHKMTRKACRL